MKTRRTSPATATGLGLLAGIICCLPRGAWAETPSGAVTGANVDESRVQKTLYVDPAQAEAADDDKHGTPDAPLATLRYACIAATELKDAGVGVKILLASGTYRETGEIPGPAMGKKDTDAPLVIEAADREQAVIDGADTGGWTPSTWKADNGRWMHPWTFWRGNNVPGSMGANLPSGGAARRRGDLVFVNDTVLQQVNTEAELAPGHFWVVPPVSSGKGHETPNTILSVQPPEGTSLEGAVVQVGARAGGLKISGRRNVVVRGVTCQHAANPAGTGYAEVDVVGIDVSYCSNVLVEDVVSQWNDGVGLQFRACTDVTLRRVRSLHNGSSGLMMFQPKNILVEDCEASFNDFRGDWSGCVDPSQPSAVFEVGAVDAAWRRLHAVGNFDGGLELDSGADLTVENSVLTDNVTSGLWVRFCVGPVIVRQCVVAGTKARPTAGKEVGSTGGIVLTSSAGVTLESNILADNAITQLSLWETTVAKPPVRSERHITGIMSSSATTQTKGFGKSRRARRRQV